MKKQLLVAFLICWTVFGPFAALSLRPVVAFAVCGGSSPNLTAASAGRTDVNDCVTAAVDGDTIAVPAGTQTWTTPITITNKSISLIGAGSGSTIISGSGTGTLIWTTKATGGSPAGAMRLSGFKFQSSGGGGCTGEADRVAMVDIKGSTANGRIDHNEFVASACGGIHMHQNFRGVFDHNTITNTNLPGTHVLIIEHESFHDISSGSTQATCCGDGSWSEDSTMGTADQLYIEDNQFINACSPLTNCWYFSNDFVGARVVYRFNRFVDAITATHGTESGGRYRGFRHWEQYRNKFEWSAVTSWPSVGGLRGGTGRLFDNVGVNVGAGSLQRMYDQNVYRRDAVFFEAYPFGRCGTYSVTSLTRSGTTASATITGYVPDANNKTYVASGGAWLEILGVANETGWNGVKRVVGTGISTFDFTVPNSGATTATGTITVRSAFDGNTNTTGYPCMDGLGRGKSILITGTEPNGLASDYAAPNPNPPQPAANILEPAYAWHNMNNGTLSALADNNPSDVTTEEVDFYNENTSYTGATGIGRGNRASRPGTCTAGTAWWALDGGGNWNTSTTETFSALISGLSSGADGGLDLCDSTNHWTNDWYVPYTYPHPLISGGGGDPPPGPSPTEDDPAASFMAREF